MTPATPVPQSTPAPASPRGLAARTLAAIPTFVLFARAMRVHQWVKNALVFVPLVLGGKAGDATAWATAGLAFLALSLSASATYIFNDLVDLEADRAHWSKCTRPIASGAVSIPAAVALALAALATGFGLAALVSKAALAVLALYIILTVSYSLLWKRVAILDVTVLATLFTVRIGIGIVAAHVALSPWLLVFSMFVFGSLSIAKRHTEIVRMAERGVSRIPGRGYTSGDGPLTLGLGLASMQGAVLILILYLIEDAFPHGFYRNAAWLWLLPPIVFLFLARIWLMASRAELDDDPVAFALKDGICLGLAVALCLAVVFAVLGLGHALKLG